MDHKDHRNRMRQRYLRGDRLEDHELLEMLLFYSRPRVNTNEIAHELIDTAGSLGKVFEVNESELKSVEGVGENSVLLIRLISDIMQRCDIERCDTSKLFFDEIERQKYMCSLFVGAFEEKAYMILFGKTKKYIGTVCIGSGVFNEVSGKTMKAVDDAIERKAAYAYIVHNHPAGIAVASDTDRETAKKMNTVFAAAEIKILGHYVVAEHKCYLYATDKND